MASKKSRKKRVAERKQGERTEPSVPSQASGAPVEVEESTKPVRSEKTAATAAPLAAEHSGFWFGFSVSQPKLDLFRVVLFTLLAIDALLQIAHAPRYGAGGFNVGHFAFLDRLCPRHTTYLVCQLIISASLACAACGVLTRGAVAIAATLYTWIYFSSQLDSYQHHYMVVLVLWLCCFVRWHNKGNESDGKTPLGGWALRLIMVQVGIVYFWAAISKTEGQWVSGAALAGHVGSGMKSFIESTGGFGLHAKFTMLAEFALALTFCNLRTRWVALAIGVPLHLGIIATGLEIGVFAYLMLALYTLLLPDRWFAWFRVPQLGSAKLAIFVSAGAFVVGVGLLLFVRFSYSLAVFLVVVTIIVGVHRALHRRPGAMIAAVAPLFVATLWLVVDRTSETTYDYYRFWAGSESRIGDKNKAIALYTKVTELFPQRENGFYQLAKLQIAMGGGANSDAALSNLHRAQELEPKKARAYVVEARHLKSLGKTAEAAEVIRKAVEADPANVEAQTLLRQLGSAQAPPGTGSAQPRPVPAKPQDTDDGQ